MKVLHVGCGNTPIDPYFTGWEEIRYDIDPEVKPDFVGSITDINIPFKVEAVYCSHTLEHLIEDQVPLALAQFKKVLVPGGIVLIAVPDMEEVLKLGAEYGLEHVAYNSPAGPVRVMDMIWGFGPYVKDSPFYEHKTGFDKELLEKIASEAGFSGQIFKLKGYNLVAKLTLPEQETIGGDT
jgi:SAM-dependent methyltransferase